MARRKSRTPIIRFLEQSLSAFAPIAATNSTPEIPEEKDKLPVKKRLYVLLIGMLIVLTGCGQGSGDRVLVAKYIYEIEIDGVECTHPQRHDVVVFRFPAEPVHNGAPYNYIKRLIGLAGETILVIIGQLFFTTDFSYPEDDDKNHLELWNKKYTHPESYAPYRSEAQAIPPTIEAFFKDFSPNDQKSSKTYQIIRKDPAVMLAMRRIVYDNDHQAQDLLDDGFPRRWTPERKSSWEEDGRTGFQNSGQGGSEDWVRYQHLLRPKNWPSSKDPNYKEKASELIQAVKPQLIKDFSSYNQFQLDGGWQDPPLNWVGDLMLEVELTVEEPKGEFWLELSKGTDRFQARWELETGLCTLYRLRKGKEDPEPEKIASASTSVNKAGTYELRLANFDQELTVWVDRQLPFEEESTTYEPAWEFDPKSGTLLNAGPTLNDLEPASFASKGASVKVNHMRLWRDTHYTVNVEKDEQLTNDAGLGISTYNNSQFWSTPEQWDSLRKPKIITRYVQPGHYLCFGDNSPRSYDGRHWGLVPERLLLGRALAVYFPFPRAGLIH